MFNQLTLSDIKIVKSAHIEGAPMIKSCNIALKCRVYPTQMIIFKITSTK